MKGKLKYVGVLACLALAVLVGVPAGAEAFDVVFYELSENATFVFDKTGAFVKRVAEEGVLAGEAQVGTPLCPRRLVRELVAAGLMRDRTPCYVTATGASDEIDAFGAGSLQATIQVKVQLDNPVDAPELVVMVAQIEDQLQVIDSQQRLIMISGTVRTTHVLDTSTFSLVEVSGRAKPFTGRVRLPFVIEQDGTSRKARRGEKAFYLADDGTLIPVQSNERSLGLPTARFELNF